MGFRSIGEIAAKMSAKALENSSFPLKRGENEAMVNDEPEQRANAEPALTEKHLNGASE